MRIVNVRIDERLIHGQVVTLWTNQLGITNILVIDDDVAEDDIQKSILEMATPPGIKLFVFSVADAVVKLDDKFIDDRIFVIFKNPHSVLEFLRQGGYISELNVGNISHKKDSKRILKSVSLTKEEVRIFKQINNYDVRIIAQMVPNDKQTNFMNLINEVSF